MDTDNVYIYALLDENDVIRYIGKSNNPKVRYYSHICSAKNKKTHKECWIYGLISRGLKPSLKIIEECTFDTWSDREKFHIASYDNLTNLTEGGEDGSGHRHSEETKKMMSITRMGEKNAFYNKNHTKETKKRLSDINKERDRINGNLFKDKHHTDKSKSLISNAGKKRWGDGRLHLPPVMIGENNPSSKRRIFISPSNEKYTVFSTKNFCNEHNLSYDIVKKSINAGKIALPTDRMILARQRGKSLNTIGWEIIE